MTAYGNRGGGPIRRVLFCLLTLTITIPTMAQGPEAAYKGRAVADVIDDFRAQGWPFAYSTGLVTDELIVREEPAAGNAVAIVRQILAPHNLALRPDEGMYLIVRGRSADVGTGDLLVIVRDGRDFSPIERSTVSSIPALTAAAELGPGITQYAEVAAKTYRLDVAANGFKTKNRIVRVAPGQTNVVTVELEQAAPEIETVTVSASRYELSRDLSNSLYFFDQRTIQTLPDLGEDALRAAHRLPGAAAGGFSARSYFRGGDETETGVILNGQRLFDPFHIRDYQNIFSSIDSRAIEGIEVYTGGFPVRYGDRMSGVVLMESLDLTRPRHNEIGLSVFNTSLLTAGVADDGDTKWLFSARRGNLDLIIDKKYGEPKYYDLFGEVSLSLTADTRVSFNGLYADDGVLVVLESEIDEIEQARSDTRNAQAWITLDTDWSSTLSSSTVVSLSSFSNHRTGATADIEKIVSAVDDDRSIDRYGLRSDWSWLRSETHLLQWGIEAARGEASYRYRGEAQFFELRAIFEGVPDSLSRDLTASPQGDSYAAYVSDKWRVLPGTVLEFGLRWDRQTYTDLSDDSQLSPRFSILQALNPSTEMRVSWGRYYQSQGIQELQIEDGVTNFFPAQRADHIIVGLRRQLGENHSLRVELFRKDMDELRPRFENLFNPLALIPELTPDRIRIDSTRARAHGVEISLDRQGGPLNWWANYTYSEVADRVDSVRQLRSWDQTHAFQAGLNWSLNDWDVGVAMNVHTGWPTTQLSLVQDGVDANDEPVLVAVPGPRNASRHPTFASLDFRVSRQFDLRQGTLTAFFEVSNATNRDNVCCSDYDLEQDDNGSVFLERSDDYWLPLLPAIGVLWEF